jgi:hypothetical protein
VVEAEEIFEDLAVDGEALGGEGVGGGEGLAGAGVGPEGGGVLGPIALGFGGGVGGEDGAVEGFVGEFEVRWGAGCRGW